MTEFLSLLRWLDFWPVLGAWGIVSLLLLLFLVFGSQKHGDLRLNLQLNSLSRFEFSLLLYLFLIVVVIGVIAWVAPPNTWDSMTYHMSRVIHWIQNKSVTFYPTNILRQLHQTPWSEFAILHFQILTGGDRFANFIQWFSMVGSIVGVSLLAKELKATIRGQVFAAVVCGTIPMGIMQGSSTQTDYVVGLWLVCFVYFAMLLRKKVTVLHALGTGMALGLCILTKATAYIFAFPFLVWLGLSSINPRHAKKMVLVALALVIAFVINLGHYARNFDLYGNPLGPGQESATLGYANEVFSFSATTSNLVRNIGLHLGTPFGQGNTALTNAIAFLHKFIGISPSDARTTWAGTEFQIPQASFHEQTAGNPVQLFLIIAALFLYVFQRPKERDAGTYIFSLLLAFVLFCVYLKWQPWNSRLHLPLFILWAPLLGLMISRTRHDKTANILMVSLIVMALPLVFYNKSKPFLGKINVFTTNRNQQYFEYRPELAGPYIEAAQILSGLHCSDIGLDIGLDDWEYPLWVLLREKTNGVIRMEHVNVTNISQRKNDVNHLSTFNPCAIFAVNSDPPNTVSIGDIVYLREWSSDPVSVYTRTLSP
jgi:4-amino-4-deoxy-L-arabinose transferase-like glycosyltransferase